MDDVVEDLGLEVEGRARPETGQLEQVLHDAQQPVRVADDIGDHCPLPVGKLREDRYLPLHPHLAALIANGGSFPFSHFAFPAGTFDKPGSMLAMGQSLESIFIGAYLGAVKAGASNGTSLGIFVAEVAAQICGIECEHRVLINDIAGIDPPNDRFCEGDVLSPPSGALGDSGARSQVYATAGDAVNALVGLGISPSA